MKGIVLYCIVLEFVLRNGVRRIPFVVIRPTLICYDFTQNKTLLVHLRLKINILLIVSQILSINHL